MEKCPHCGKKLIDDFALTAPSEKRLPEWLPMPEWEAFLEMRKKIPRAPWTANAERMTINKLDKLRRKGYDPAELLESATMSSWRTVYEPKENGFAGKNGNHFEAEREQIRRVVGNGR